MSTYQVACGELKHPVVVERRTQAQDNVHGTPERWERALVVWAKITPQGEQEHHNETGSWALNRYQIVTRYTPHITTDTRLRHNNKILHIVSLLNLSEADRWLEIVCQEAL